jgi:hypothetical protein
MIGSSADICGNPTGATDNYDFSQMVTAGFLNDAGKPASGNTYMYDNCSQTVSVSSPLPFCLPFKYSAVVFLVMISRSCITRHPELLSHMMMLQA